MNLYFVFMQNGEEFFCNLCGTRNRTPDFYFCKTVNGERKDKNKRIELNSLYYDILAPKKFSIKKKIFHFSFIYLVIQ